MMPLMACFNGLFGYSMEKSQEKKNCFLFQDVGMETFIKLITLGMLLSVKSKFIYFIFSI